jgi:hypothetical protein
MISKQNWMKITYVMRNQSRYALQTSASLQAEHRQAPAHVNDKGVACVTCLEV